VVAGTRADLSSLQSPSFQACSPRKVVLNTSASSWPVWTATTLAVSLVFPSEASAELSLTLVRFLDVHLLEDYLQQQLANDQYDILANLALLKL
jgi:predicted MPP superfamily phosphohydrolase